MISNRRGQTLIMFIILIPIMLGFVALVVDVGLITSEKKHLEDTLKMVIRETYDKKDVELVKNLINKNDIDEDNLDVSYKDNILKIGKEEEIDSIFGKIVGIKSYKVKVEIVGYKKNNKLIIE